MFGDCGHGVIMMLFAIWMVLNEKRLENFKEGGEVRSKEKYYLLIPLIIESVSQSYNG